jgi:hypothetical protein
MITDVDLLVDPTDKVVKQRTSEGISITYFEVSSGLGSLIA